jgi:hypothetical protein
MQVYEIVLDGELTTDLSDSLGPLPRRQEGGATILTVPLPDAEALARILGLLESLGFGVTAMHQVEHPTTSAHDPE